MCGIVAVVPFLEPPRTCDLTTLVRSLEAARIPVPAAVDWDERTLRHAETALSTANALLAWPNAEQRLLADSQLVLRLRAVATRLECAATRADRWLDYLSGTWEPAQLEAVRRSLTCITEALLTLRHDRLGRVDTLRRFLGGTDDAPAIAPAAAVTCYGAIETALRCVDRLDARGRTSAGVHVWVRGPKVWRVAADATGEIAGRSGSALAQGAVTAAAGGFAFTYRTSSRTGAPGVNVRALREAMMRDTLLARTLHTLGAHVTVLAHTTRAHATMPARRAQVPYCVGALNGTLVRLPLGRVAEGGARLISAFADTVASLAGPITLVAQTDHEPDALLLAARGRGQLYVGMAPGAWVAASEPSGLVRETSSYLRVGGARRDGGLVVLRRDGSGDFAGLTRYDLAGHHRPVTASDITQGEKPERDLPHQQSLTGAATR